MDQPGSSSSSGIVIKQEVILEDDEQPSELEYYSYRSDDEHEWCEPPLSAVESLDSEETMDANSPPDREEGNVYEDAQTFVPVFKKKLAAYASKMNPDDPWHCTMCSHKCKHEKSMIVHIEKHVQNLDKSLENSCCCLTCLTSFPSKKELEKHRKTHHQPNINSKKRPSIKRFLCKICRKKFPSSNVLREHYRNMHGSYEVVGTLDCPECGKMCAKTTIYSAHVVTHADFKLCKYFCDACRMPLLKGDVERHRHKHKEGRMSAVNGNVLWRTREESPDPDGSDTQSIPDDLPPTGRQESGKEPDIEQDLPCFAVMKTNAPALAIVKEEVIIEDTEFDEEVW